MGKKKAKEESTTSLGKAVSSTEVDYMTLHVKSQNKKLPFELQVSNSFLNFRPALNIIQCWAPYFDSESIGFENIPILEWDVRD